MAESIAKTKGLQIGPELWVLTGLLHHALEVLSKAEQAWPEYSRMGSARLIMLIVWYNLLAAGELPKTRRKAV